MALIIDFLIYTENYYTIENLTFAKNVCLYCSVIIEVLVMTMLSILNPLYNNYYTISLLIFHTKTNSIPTAHVSVNESSGDWVQQTESTSPESGRRHSVGVIATSVSVASGILVVVLVLVITALVCIYRYR